LIVGVVTWISGSNIQLSSWEISQSFKVSYRDLRVGVKKADVVAVGFTLNADGTLPKDVKNSVIQICNLRGIALPQ